MPIKTFLIFFIIFLFQCDDGKETKYRVLQTITIEGGDYKYSIRNIWKYGPSDKTKIGRTEFMFVEYADKILLNMDSEKTQFTQFLQYYLDNNESIPENENLNDILVYDKYYRSEYSTSEPWILSVLIEKDSISNKYVVKNIICR
jgi:hypothetical protein